MLKLKLSLKTFFLFTVMFFIFSGQTSLESQMKELNRLQAQLQALQSGTNQETLDVVVTRTSPRIQRLLTVQFESHLV